MTDNQLIHFLIVTLDTAKQTKNNSTTITILITAGLYFMHTERGADLQGVGVLGRMNRRVGIVCLAPLTGSGARIHQPQCKLPPLGVRRLLLDDRTEV